MSRPRSKKELASDHIQEGLSHIGKAISLLGGRTRALSVTKNQQVFVVRKYLQSVESRLQVCDDLLKLANVTEGSVVVEDSSSSPGAVVSGPDDNLAPTPVVRDSAGD